MDNDFKVEAIRLVQAIEKHPVLYDNNIKKYSGRIGQTDAWNKVALETKNNPSTCREKWQGIRSTFVRFLKSNSKKNFYLLEHLQFLIPFLNFRNDEGVTDFTNEPSPEVNSTQTNAELLTSTNKGNLKEIEFNKSDIVNINKPMIKSKLKRKHEDLCISDDEGDDSDVFFFKSVWADVRKMNMTQKIQFRISVLNSMEKILCYSEPSSSCTSHKRKTFS